MDTKVLFKLTYGLYVVGAADGDRHPAGCVINTCFQVTSEDPSVAISLNKDNYTLEALRRSGKFSLSIIAEDTDPSVIGRFGFSSSRDTDKYAGFGYETVDGVPMLNGVFSGRLILEPKQYVDCGTHILVVSSIVGTVAGEGEPMTYAYYHKVVKGRAPKNAPTYVAPEREEESPASAVRRFECDVCHYIAETGGELADDFVCPVCNADRSHFHEI